MAYDQIKPCAKLKHWQPDFDENGTPSGFHTTVALANLRLVSAEALEQCLVVAGRNHGRRGFQQSRFVSSRLLTDLRFRRRQTNDFFFASGLFSAIRSQRAVVLGSFQALGLFLHWQPTIHKSKAFILANSQITSERTVRLEIKSGKMLIETMFKMETFADNGIWNWPMDATSTATSRIC